MYVCTEIHVGVNGTDILRVAIDTVVLYLLILTRYRKKTSLAELSISSVS